MAISPLHILHTECSLNWGGQELRICQEAQWLNAHGHPCWVACPAKSEIFRRGNEMGVPMLPVSMRNSFDLYGMVALNRIVKEKQIQLINSHSSKDTWVSYPQFLKGTPVLRTRHLPNAVRPGFIHSFGYRQGVTRVAASALSIKEALIRDNKVRPENIDIIGEFVDLERFQPNVVDGSAFRAEFEVAPDAPFFILPGMIRSEKGHTTFLDAALLVLKKHPKARFAIVGEGTGERRLEKKCRARLQSLFGDSELIKTPVVMAGYRNDVRVPMIASDVVVVPSHAEAQTRVAPEAMALGRCVIASAVGGLPEVVKNGETGLLVPPRDSAALADAMSEMIENSTRRAELAANALAYAQTSLSIDTRMEETMAIYRKLIKH
jgi:glycosyltransferase involved in cell wall biosynthesis